MSITDKQRLALNDFSSKQYELNPNAQQGGKSSVLSGGDGMVNLGDIIEDLTTDLSLGNFAAQPALVTPTGAVRGVINGGGQYIAWGDSGTLATSTDGVAWTPRISGFAGWAIKQVIWDGNRYIAVGGSVTASGGGRISTSPDGVTWTPRTSNASITLHTVASNGTTAIAIGGVVGAGIVGTVISSTNGGITWNTVSTTTIPGYVPLSATYLPTNLIYNPSSSKFSLVWFQSSFPNGASSSDGISWTANYSGFGLSNAPGIASSATMTVVVGDGPSIYTSADGARWTTGNFTGFPTSLTNFPAFTGIKYLNNNWVAWGSLGLLATSSDGYNWTARTSNTTTQFLCAEYGAGLYVLAGTSGAIHTSADLISWTSTNSNITTGNINDIRFGNNLFVAGSVGGKISTSPDGLTWTPQTSNANHIDFTSIAYGNNTYFAIGYSLSSTNTTGVSSTNGTAWTGRVTLTQASSGTRAAKVVFGNGSFAIVSLTLSGSVVKTSADGITWTAVSTGLGGVSALDYTNNTFFAGSSTQIAYAVSATTGWALASTPSSFTISAFAGSSFGYCAAGSSPTVGQSGVIVSATGSVFNTVFPQVPCYISAVTRTSTVQNGTAFIVSLTGRMLSCTNGSTWHSQTSNMSGTITDVAYGNGAYVAVGSNGELVSSTNGSTWITRSSGFSTTNIAKVAYNTALTSFFAVGASNRISTSPDGTTWTSQTSNFAGTDLIGVASSTSVTPSVVAIANISSVGFASQATNITTWSIQPLQFGTNLFASAVYGNGVYVLAGSSGALATSPDLINWTSRNPKFGFNNIKQVIFVNGIFVAVGNGGVISTSGDGITWTNQTSQFGTDNILGIIYANNLFVAYGGSGKISTSADGLTWTAQTSQFGAVNINNVIYENNLFVAAGDSGYLSTSVDGLTWIARTANFDFNNIHTIAYGGNTYIIGGANAYLATSTNGITWTNQISNLSSTITNIVYGNDKFVLKGSGNNTAQVAFSVDNGVTWNLFTGLFGSAMLSGQLIFANDNFLLAGATIMYSSSDGIKWTPRLTAAIGNISFANNTFFAMSSASNVVYIAYT